MRVELLRVNSAVELDEALPGYFKPENVLKWACLKALQNGNGRPVAVFVEHVEPVDPPKQDHDK